METVSIIILAIVQGIAEFLPISSSGHLVLGSELFGIEKDATSDINIVLHLGTLFSILLFYHKRIWRLLSHDRKAILPLIVGTIPAVAIGLVVKLKYDHLLESVPLTGAMFPITGLVLLALTWRKDEGELEYQTVPLHVALIVGLSQAIALLPGISRSGFTIAAGLMMGLKRESAATFSFLLAIPAIAGGALLEAIKLYKAPPAGIEYSQLGIGMVISFAVGLASLFWLVKLVERGKLYWFAIWLIPLGIGTLVWCYAFDSV